MAMIKLNLICLNISEMTPSQDAGILEMAFSISRPILGNLDLFITRSGDKPAEGD